MVRRLVWVVLTGVLLGAAGCGGGSGNAGITTTLPGDRTFEGVTFSIGQADDGDRLRISIGDEVVARLTITDPGAPAWEVTRVPEPRVLSTGDRFRFIPSVAGAATPYDEFAFRATGEGTEMITFTQTVTGESMSVTVIVTAG